MRSNSVSELVRASRLKLLSDANIALCISDHRMPRRLEAHRQFRLRPRTWPDRPLQGHYKPATLAEWKMRIVRWDRRAHDVYVYFDNDQKSAAPVDAERLTKIL